MKKSIILTTILALFLSIYGVQAATPNKAQAQQQIKPINTTSLNIVAAPNKYLNKSTDTMKLLRKKSRTYFDMQHIVFDPSLRIRTNKNKQKGPNKH